MAKNALSQSALRLTIGRKTFPVADFADASLRYQRSRGTKSSNHVPEGVVTDAGGNPVARVSYNGRVWAPGPWQPGDEPIVEATHVDA